MIIIGLTGSIGTGKSTVTKQFAQCGAATLNSDLVVHRLLSYNGEAVEPVARLFPEAKEGSRIDRKKLGAMVFGQSDKLRQLEAIIHPLVQQSQDRFLEEQRSKGMQFAVLDIPLLFETGGEKRCNVTVVTTAPYALQRQRVMSRPHMTEEKFKRILAAQMPDEEKRTRGDFVISTASGKTGSLKAVKRILLQLSRKDGSILT